MKTEINSWMKNEQSKTAKADNIKAFHSIFSTREMLTKIFEDLTRNTPKQAIDHFLNLKNSIFVTFKVTCNILLIKR